MKNLIRQLKDFGFKKTGQIKLNSNKTFPEFILNDKKDKSTGIVYMWVINDKSIKYIGKAGKTLKARNNQHESGFRKSKGKSETAKGITNGQALLEILKRRGNKISIYSKKSVKKIFHGQKVSLCDAEEQALIKHFKPDHQLLNGSRKKKGSRSKESSKKKSKTINAK